MDNNLVSLTFNDRFSSHGWCAYDSMNFFFMESTNENMVIPP